MGSCYLGVGCFDGQSQGHKYFTCHLFSQHDCLHQQSRSAEYCSGHQVDQETRKIIPTISHKNVG